MDSKIDGMHKYSPADSYIIISFKKNGKKRDRTSHLPDIDRSSKKEKKKCQVLEFIYFFT